MEQTKVARDIILRFAKELGKRRALSDGEFAGADLWRTMRSTMPAFAFVAVWETYFREKTNTNFILGVEDELFTFFRELSPYMNVPLDKSGLSKTELRGVCDLYQCEEDIKIAPVTILDMLFAGRVNVYQEDWKAGMQRLIVKGESGRSVPEYVSIRVAAELEGVPLPNSLVDLTLSGLGLDHYVLVEFDLIEFANAYMTTFPATRRSL